MAHITFYIHEFGIDTAYLLYSHDKMLKLFCKYRYQVLLNTLIPCLFITQYYHLLYIQFTLISIIDFHKLHKSFQKLFFGTHIPY